jgi:hypothetical protein
MLFGIMPLLIILVELFLRSIVVIDFRSSSCFVGYRHVLFFLMSFFCLFSVVIVYFVVLDCCNLLTAPILFGIMKWLIVLLF